MQPSEKIIALVLHLLHNWALAGKSLFAALLLSVSSARFLRETLFGGRPVVPGGSGQ